MSLILCERDGAVALVTLNRPDQLNALSTALEEELAATLASPAVREASALIIRGAGDRAFSAGADTAELDVATPETALAYYEDTGNVYEQLARLAVPSIAQIHGWCVGGGLEMALACDLRVATESARFWFPEVERGILPSSGGTARAVRALGPAVARRLILLGEKIDARQALALGLIHEVVPDGEVAATAMAWAQALASRPRRAIQVARVAIDAAADGSHAAALAAERLGYAALAGLE
jgi:enoyl-CoA hydratase/carnithine racemase